ncbi:response regulator transcription factor [Deinococcus cellulosilyticus]|uniref:Response regulatory domain-containing protein n=1 Tax=Deinococcus cellulosilyticus (strain DSM 18568 / NBRC 106333 / KACC 11606 / 5516J-15) TaxID=1223518 RepID=A0A511N5Z2_DEIC1|nr:response regulator [Deinococcus cellulosilyticus]GEM48280.1 hypothetical protein DC3_39150 [Deinococcus cellulosilyticus NBRC 106333 = KACC 11606]
MQRILLVDDEEQILQLLEMFLEMNGYRPVLAHSRQEALRQVASNDIDLAILDVCLDDANGFDLGREIKADHPQLPLVFLTGLSAEKDRETGLSIGNAYLVKPFQPDVLLNVIQQQLSSSPA